MIRWTLLSGVLHLVWETVQLPLYTIWVERDAEGLAAAVAHCTLGDLLITASTYLLAAAASRDWRWPLRRPLAGSAIAIPAGIAYTAFSEWRNVFVVGAWAYTQSMPQVVGIGLSPLLQWFFVPLAALVLLRAIRKRSVDLDQSAPSDAA